MAPLLAVEPTMIGWSKAEPGGGAMLRRPTVSGSFPAASLVACCAVVGGDEPPSVLSDNFKTRPIEPGLCR